MSVYLFGEHAGHLGRRADSIARRHGADHIDYTEPCGERRGWFSCANLGPPFDEARARAVLADIARAGLLPVSRQSLRPSGI